MIRDAWWNLIRGERTRRKTVNIRLLKNQSDVNPTIGVEVSLDYDNMMIEKPGVIEGTITRGQCITRVQLMVCQSHRSESRLLIPITNYYASHVQCFLSGWCTVQLFSKLTRRREAILWKVNEDEVIMAGITKYEARGYTFRLPEPQLYFPRPHVRIGDGSAGIVNFSNLYKEFISYAPEFKSEIDRYIAFRELGLGLISWYINDKGRLSMTIDGELNDIRESTHHQGPIRMLKYIAMYVPEGSDIIQEEG